ncbi:MAG: hypothetical protein AAF211_33115, partial [Myxococcota bacterium]
MDHDAPTRHRPALRLRARDLLDLAGAAPFGDLQGLPDPTGARLRALRLHRAALIGLLAFMAGYMLIGIPVVLQWRSAYMGLHALWFLALSFATSTLVVELAREVGRLRRGVMSPARGYRPVGESLGLQLLVGGPVALVVLTRVLTVLPSSRPAVHLLYDPDAAPRAAYEAAMAPLVLASVRRFGVREVRI